MYIRMHVCMYVSMYVCMYVFITHVCTCCIQASMHTYAYMCLHTYTRKYVCVHIYVNFVSAYIHTKICMCTYIYVNFHGVYIYKCICVCTQKQGPWLCAYTQRNHPHIYCLEPTLWRRPVVMLVMFRDYFGPGYPKSRPGTRIYGCPDLPPF